MESLPADGSRLPGWYKVSRKERIARIAERLGLAVEEVAAAVEGGGLSPDDADRMVEDVLGTYGLPFAVAPNFQINGRDVLVPMVIEEPSVVAAAANAARMVRDGGGFRVHTDPPHMVCQVQVFARDREAATARILAAKADLLARAAGVDPVLARLGGGPVDLEVRAIDGGPEGDGFLVVHLVVDVRDAMGANTVNTMGEAIAPVLEGLAGAPTGLRILSNLADRRKVRVEATVPLQSLRMEGFEAAQVRDGIVSASRFAELDPYRAATHNKGILNGTDAVILATGNDWRAVEAGAHAYAALGGRYRPLCTWRRQGDDLAGSLEMPMAVGIVGGATRVHPGARLALRIMEARSAADLASVAASAGMANNLAALKALATEGIQKGHMRLHARSRSLER